MHRTFYGPTFKGDVYALAAAREALAVYREADVPRHVGDHGSRLREGVNSLCREAGLRAELSGPPFRMVLTFQEPNERRQVLLRTLAQQELLKRGILTYKGFLLPSLAHDEQALQEALAAFAAALPVVAAADSDDAFARHLEIPAVL
jgi:glutamate-1-semialdehyde aminotransferase